LSKDDNKDPLPLLPENIPSPATLEEWSEEWSADTLVELLLLNKDTRDWLSTDKAEWIDKISMSTG
jgi:hypothetical protein